MYCGASQLIEVKLGAAHTTNALPWASMAIDTAGVATAANGETNGTAVVAVVAATKGALKTLLLRNADTIPQTLSVVYHDDATSRVIAAMTLAVGDSLEYNSQGGFRVYDSSGALRSSSAANVAKLDYKQSWTKSQTMTAGAITSASNVATWDLDAKQNAKFTLTENVTSWAAFANGAADAYYTLELTQDASAAKTVSWDSDQFKGMSGYTMSTALGAVDHLTFRATSSTVLRLVGFRQNVGA